MSAPDNNPNAPKPLPSRGQIPPRPPKIIALDLVDAPDPRSSIIDELAYWMATRYPSANARRTKISINYHPDDPDGFTVRLIWKPGAEAPYRIYFERAWQEFRSRSEAVVHFKLALSSECTVREYFYSGREYRWIVVWHRLIVGADYVDFWPALGSVFQAPQCRCLQNHLADSAENGAESAVA